MKVEQLAEGGSAPTQGSIVTSSTNDSKESAPSPMLRMGSMHENEGTPTTSAVHAFGNEQPTGCDHAPAMGCKAKRAAWGCRGAPHASWSRAQRLAVVYWNGENQGEADDYRNENIPIRLIDLSHDKNDDV